MNVFAKAALKMSLIIATALALFFSTSCDRTEYAGQYFSFPPGSKPHNKDWQYAGQVIVSSNQSPITKKSKKNVEIKVYDKSKTTFLSDKFEFVCASIDANVVWEKFEEIRIELFEVGNEYANDPYNANLLKSGPKSLIKLKYKYHQEENKFRQAN